MGLAASNILGHWSWRRWLAAAILVVALGARVGYVLATPGYVPVHDDHAYDTMALGVARNGAYPVVGGRATAYRPPGYSYALGGLYAVVGSGHDRIEIARLAQALLGTAIVALLGLLARRLMGANAGLWAMGVSALYLPLIAVGASLLSESLFAALELAALLVVLEYRRAGEKLHWAVVAGLLGGLLALTRSNGLVVLPALAVGLWIGRPWRSWSAVAPLLAMVAVALVVIAPWTVRNAVVMHSFIPISDEQGNTLAGTYNPVSDHDRSAPASWHLLTDIPDYRQRTVTEASRPEPVLQSRLLSLAWRYVRHHPAYPAKVGFYNGMRLLELGGMAHSRFTAQAAGISSAGVADAAVICFWIVGLLAISGLVLSRVRRGVPGFIWLAAALVLASIIFVNTETPRFRIPLDPYVILLAAGALAVACERVARAHGAEVGARAPDLAPAGTMLPRE